MIATLNKNGLTKSLLLVSLACATLIVALSGCMVKTPGPVDSPEASSTIPLAISSPKSPVLVPSPTPELPTPLDDSSSFVESGTVREHTILFIALEPSLPLERTAITWNGQEIVVVNNATRTLEFYHTVTGELIQTVDFSEGISDTVSITGLTWDGKRYWMADANEGKIMPFDVETGELEEGFGVEAVPEDLAWDGEALWIAQYSPGRIERRSPEGVLLDTKSLSIPWPSGLTWGSDCLWFSDPRTGDVWKLNLTTGEESVVLSHSLARGSFGGLGWSDGYLWLLDDGLGRLYQLNVLELNL